MTAYADKNEADSKDEITMDSHSIAYDMILEFNDNNKLATDKLYDYEEARELYEDMYQGLIINDDLEEFKRKSPPRLLEVKPGERIKLSYHAGGYDLTGWLIKDPFSETAPEFVPFFGMPRFTIKVT